MWMPQGQNPSLHQRSLASVKMMFAHWETLVRVESITMSYRSSGPRS